MENGGKNSAILAIFFDLDNTLISTRKADTLACNKLADCLWKKYGIVSEKAKTICNQFLRSFRKCPENENMDLDAWRCLLWSQALGDDYNDYTDEIYQKWLKLRYHYLVLTPEIQSMLRNLRQHYFLALITNGPSMAQWEKVNKLNLQQYFDIILVSGDLPWEKPHDKIFQEASDFLGIETSQCIMVGDKLDTDIMGGINAGLAGTVWVPLNNSKQIDSDNPRPDYIIDNVIELPKLLPQFKHVSNFRNKMNRFSNKFNKGICLSDVDDCNSNSSDGS